MIVDAHLHLDERLGSALEAARELENQLAAAGIARAIVLHLETQPWSVEEVSEALAQCSRLRGFINVHPEHADAEARLRDGIERFGYIGLKLHPRLQEYGVDDASTIRLVSAAGEMGVPVLVDAFPDGTHLMQGFSPVRYAVLAKQCPRTRIIWAHMGGHYVMDFMMLAKRLPNVYVDFSYSLLYYQRSSVPVDMAYAMRSMRFERVFYGSDYPDRSIADTLAMTLAFLRTQEIDEAQLARIMGGNAQAFFGWDDL